MADISAVLSSTQIALEKQAADAFGAVVEDFTRGTLGFPSTTPPVSRIAPREPSTWYSTAYAAALSGGTSYRPKLKFLFKVEFIFKPEVLAVYPVLRSNDFTFMIKSIDRPKVDLEYEDDVNRYNFRTKVLKRVRHRELTVTFLDDTGNRVFDFFRTLMFLHSPITQRAALRDGTIAPPTSSSALLGSGMAFSSLGQAGYGDISHRGVVNSNVGGVMEAIRVKQLFVNPAAANIQDATQQVTFDFLNPRVISFDLDDLTHEASDASLLTMQFDYDWLEMVKVGTLKAADGPIYNIAVPNTTNLSVDVLSNSNPPAESRTGSNPIPSAGGTNPVVAILSNQAARAAQKITNDAINRAVRTTAGGGRFATDVAGRLTGALGSTVNGIIGAASRDLLTGITSAGKAGVGIGVPSNGKGTTSTTVGPIANDSATLSDDNASISRSTD